MVQVPANAPYRTTRVWGGTKDYHSALQGGHSTLNTVVLGEGVSKSKYTPYFGHHSSVNIYVHPQHNRFHYANYENTKLGFQTTSDSDH